MKLPILGIDEANDIEVFATAAEAESYIEWQDADIWKVYTAEGIKLHIEVLKGTFLKSPRIRLKVTDQDAAEELKRFLHLYLKSLGYERSTDEPLDKLIDLLTALQRDHR